MGPGKETNLMREGPRTDSPVTTDGWYAHTDGTFGFYCGAARPGGPTMTYGPCAASECVKRDEFGAVYEVGWPALIDAIERAESAQ